MATARATRALRARLQASQPTRAWLSERRASLGLLVAGIALVAALVQAPGIFDNVQSQASYWEKLSEDAGTLDVARRLDIEPDMLQAARRLIPPSASIVIQTGPGYHSGSTTAIKAAVPFYRFYLLPRRAVDADQARWLICFGCDPHAWLGRLRIVWSRGESLFIARLRR